MKRSAERPIASLQDLQEFPERGGGVRRDSETAQANDGARAPPFGSA